MAQAEVNYFKSIFAWLDFYREDANRRFAALAVEYANATVAENLPDLYNEGLLEITPVQGSSLNYLTEYEEIPFTVSYRYYTSWCKYCFTIAAFNGPQSPADHVSPDHRQWSRLLSGINRTAPVSGVYVPDVLWTKISPPVTYAAYSLTQRREGYAVGNTTLSDFYPQLKVYASAKPSQGELVTGIPSYVPLLKNLTRHSPDPAIEYLDQIQH